MTGAGRSAARPGARTTRAKAARGAVTAELATALPAVVLLCLALVWAVSLAAVQLRCLDAAREGARALARHDERSAAVQLARSVAPPGARVEVAETGERVRVTVQALARAPGWLGSVPVRLQGMAVAAAEPR